MMIEKKHTTPSVLTDTAITSIGLTAVYTLLYLSSLSLVVLRTTRREGMPPAQKEEQETHWHRNALRVHKFLTRMNVEEKAAVSPYQD